MAAEQSMKARSKPGYVEPEAPGDDEDVIFLGYSTGQEDVGTSDADERGEIGENEVSEDELNDWDTVPAPPSYRKTQTKKLKIRKRNCWRLTICRRNQVATVIRSLPA